MKCRFCGTTPCWRARTAFISPSAPAADWVWPKLVFTDASAQGPSLPYTSARLAYSMGSPTGVRAVRLDHAHRSRVHTGHIQRLPIRRDLRGP